MKNWVVLQRWCGFYFFQCQCCVSYLFAINSCQPCLYHLISIINNWISPKHVHFDCRYCRMTGWVKTEEIQWKTGRSFLWRISRKMRAELAPVDTSCCIAKPKWPWSDWAIYGVHQPATCNTYSRYSIPIKLFNVNILDSQFSL